MSSVDVSAALSIQTADRLRALRDTAQPLIATLVVRTIAAHLVALGLVMDTALQQLWSTPQP